MTSGSTTRRLLGLLVAVLAVASLFVAIPSSVGPAPAASAASASDWNAGNIISDAVFYNAQTMDAGQIQTFLNGKVSRCATGSTCLKDYRQNTDNRPADRYCDGYTARANESAAEIIDRVARSCGINQQVLLVLLQKEQGLITSTAPSARMYSAAMGQGCPDTAPCDAATAGFFYQVYYAARQYEIYRLNPTSFGYQAGRWNNILYHHEASRNCGSARVFIENQATAGLYIYTPYVPNAAALANLYGTGDSCSSYGNRNFWRLFTDWFGSTQTSNAERSPFGGFNLVVERGQITVQGWALDADNPSAQLEVSLTVDGQAGWATFVADAYRPDVAAVHKGYGDYHGMNSVHQISGGDHTVCVTVRNVGPGLDKGFGCESIQVESASPQGGTSIEVLAGGIRLTGWTLDLDTTASLAVHVYIDGKASAHTADAFRPDVGQVFPGYGDNHGLDILLPLSVGSHDVCAYGINVGRGVNSLIGCHRAVITQSGDPVGALESAYPQPGGVGVQGWAIDPNGVSATEVHLYSGTTALATRTSTARADIQARFPKNGNTQGFAADLPLASGTRQVCAYGINVGFGTNALLGCKSVTVMSGNPFGGIDTQVEDGKIRLRGWTIDPDTRKSIAVHVYVNGRAQALSAGAVRPDVASVYPGYGAEHGIDGLLDLGSGTHRICAYGINEGPGANALLGCETVVVSTGSPFGGTDVTVTGQEVRLRGWTIDPDTTDPISVHVYANNSAVAVTAADKPRPDVGAAYPQFGAEHGIDTTFRLPSGRHQVCSYGISVGRGDNALLACHSVVIP